MHIEGTSAVITGGSRGLGLALARELAGRGARVVLIARDRAALHGAVASLTAAGAEAHAVVADVGRPGAEVAIAARVAELLGPVDLLVQNASTLGPLPMPLLADTRPEDLARVFEVNVLGPFRLTRALLGPMLLRGTGQVVTISSDAAVEAYPGWGAYGASKAALDHLARIWAAELEGSGVSVLTVDPGEMRTQMHADALPEADPDTLANPAAVARRIVRLLAAGPANGRVEAAA